MNREPDPPTVNTIFSRCTCSQARLQRVPRRFWMRLIPFVRLYECADCGKQTLMPKPALDASAAAAHRSRA